MNLSPNITLQEFTYSDKAKELGVPNVPPPALMPAISSLCQDCLQPIRDEAQAPMIFESGYRCDAVNRAVGGSKNSGHMIGEAADVKIQGMTPRQVMSMVYGMVQAGRLVVDQCILEPTWVHIGYTKRKENRNQFLVAVVKYDKKGKKTVTYRNYDPEGDR